MIEIVRQTNLLLTDKLVKYNEVIDYLQYEVNFLVLYSSTRLKIKIHVKTSSTEMSEISDEQVCQ